jgi:hypothetical protein
MRMRRACGIRVRNIRKSGNRGKWVRNGKESYRLVETRDLLDLNATYWVYGQALEQVGETEAVLAV